MLFYSTNRKSSPVTLRQAVLRGLAEDGGLYLPESIPQLPSGFCDGLNRLSFAEISCEVAGRFLSPDVPGGVLRDLVEEAIDFDAPVVSMGNAVYALELFHGPTLAFKDFGARFMARLMAYFHRGSDRELIVLTATSGDTGSAVAHGFFQVPGIRVVLLYPSGKVSEIQEKQMTTLGSNIVALEINGTFDDCQRLVKQAFQDPDLTENLQLTSANSINIARLIPQCFYYFRAFAQVETNHVVFSVPSGNFGNLTAGVIAKRMGLPVTRLIAATNSNDVVPLFLQTGTFEARPSVTTISNAMDVGNPSNFARILDLYDHKWERIRADISGAAFTDDQTRAAIRELFDQFGYVVDPHGAIGYLGLKKFPGSDEAAIFLETAHPAKFPDVVREATGRDVEIPRRLLDCLKHSKQSIPMSGHFPDFKSYLNALTR